MDVLFSISLCPTVHLEELPHPFNKVLSNYSNEVDPAPSYCQCVHIFSKSQVQSKKLNLFDYIDISPVDGWIIAAESKVARWEECQSLVEKGWKKKSPLMAEFTGRSYAPNASNVFYFQANEKRAEICKYAQQEGNGTRRPNVIDWLRYRFDRSLLSRYRHCFFVFFLVSFR